MSVPLVVLTGFGSFLDVDRNASGEIVRTLAGDEELLRAGALELAARELPVSIERSAVAFDELLAGLGSRRPVVVLCLGVQREGYFRLERRARARLSSEKRDVDGVLARGRVLDGPEVVETALALEPLAEALRRAGAADVRISEDAGGYVCERVYHHALVRGAERAIPTLFLHVPPLAAVELEQQVSVVRALVGELVGRVAPGL